LSAHRENLSLREAAQKLGLMKPEEFDRLVDPAAMTKPG
jgi:fumarate hydratase class II